MSDAAAASDYRFTDFVEIDASPQAVYAIVSDVTRVGEWSPVCVGAEWEDADAGAVVGAFFAGHNHKPERDWSTRSQVVEASPGQAFAWEVNGGLVAWRYDLAPTSGGTRLTESWHLRPKGVAFFHDKYAETGQREIDTRAADARSGIPASLAVIKRIAEQNAAST